MQETENFSTKLKRIFLNNRYLVLFLMMLVVVISVSAWAGAKLADSASQGSAGNKAQNLQSNSTAVVAADKCIVTVSGNSYDVTKLRKTHTGGDVFVCGTDQTKLYVRKHGESTDLIKPYLVDLAVSTVTSTSTQPTTLINATAVASHNTAGSCYVVFNGTVYDVTNHPSWKNCSHHGVKGGTDITSIFPHKLSYFDSIPVVGKLDPATAVPKASGPKGGDDGENEREVENEVETD